MTFQDKKMICVECGTEFIFTVGEQEFYAQKGFTNEPKRCRNCKAARKMGSREEYEVVCSSCGQKTTVPFKPVLDKPVYCRSCYQTRRSSSPRSTPLL